MGEAVGPCANSNVKRAWKTREGEPEWSVGAWAKDAVGRDRSLSVKVS